MASIADTLRAAVDAEETRLTDESPESAPAQAEPESSTSATPAQVAPTSEDRPGRTAGRPRDDKGRLLPGKVAAAPQDKTAPAAIDAQPAPVAAAAPRPNRPSSWAKEHWENWDKLEPSVAEYILKREGDYARGVSTYKAEAEHAQKWNQALAEFLPTLQQHGLDPIGHTQSLMRAHQRLALGSPEDKLAMFAQMARDYQVPLQRMFVQAQDGSVQFNQQLLQQQAQRAAPQQDVRKVVQETLEEERARQEIASFERDTQKYPHYKQVKETMAGLLQSGLADDLGSAYEAALRHPRHADIYEAMQEQQRQADDQRKAEEMRRQAGAARNKAVQVKSAAPTAQGSASSGNSKSVRGAVESAWDAHAEGGRV